MKNSIFITIVILFFNTVNGQIISGSDKIILSDDALNASFFSTKQIVLTNSQNVIFSGEIESGQGIIIKSNSGFALELKPTSNTANDKGGTTVIPHQSGGTGDPPFGFYDIFIFPIPTDNLLNFSCDNMKIKSYTIYDSTGNIIISNTITPTNEGIIDVSSLYSGNYILKLETDIQRFVSFNFIKN